MTVHAAEFFTLDEVNRLKIIQDVVDRRLTTLMAAQRLGISGRQCRRLLTTVTQFGRALYDLAIELICANNSEAKGRVERANQALQDRLIKEMRLEGITGIEAANA